jgi:hypothetical protein
MPKELVVEASVRKGTEKRWLARAAKRDGFCYLALFPRVARRGLANVLGASPLVEAIVALRPWWHTGSALTKVVVTSRNASGEAVKAHIYPARPYTVSPARRAARARLNEAVWGSLHGFAKVGSYRPQAAAAQSDLPSTFTGFPQDSAKVFEGFLAGREFSLREMERHASPEIAGWVEALASAMAAFVGEPDPARAWGPMFTRVKSALDTLLTRLAVAPLNGKTTGLYKKLEVVYVAVCRLAEARAADASARFVEQWASTVPVVARHQGVMPESLSRAGSVFGPDDELYTEYTAEPLGPDGAVPSSMLEWMLPDTVTDLESFVATMIPDHPNAHLWSGGQWRGDPLLTKAGFMPDELARRVTRSALIALQDGDPDAGDYIRIALSYGKVDSIADSGPAGFIAFVLASAALPVGDLGVVSPFGDRIPEDVLALIAASGLVGPDAVKSEWIAHVRPTMQRSGIKGVMSTLLSVLVTPEFFHPAPKLVPHPLVDTISIEALVVLIRQGINPDTAAAAVARVAVEVQGAIEIEAGGVSPAGTASALFEGAEKARQDGASPVDSAHGFMLAVREWCLQHGVVTTVFDFLITLVSRMWAEIRQFGYHVIAALVSAVEAAGITDRTVLVSAGTLLDAVATFVDPHYRKNPKPVWAMLFRSAQSHLKASEGLLLSLPEFHLADTESYQEWATQIISALGAMATTDLPALHADPPTRSVHFPKNTYGHSSLEPYMTNLEGRLVETARERDRLQKLIGSGAQQGIDGAWMATPEMVTESLERYTTDVSPLDSQCRALIMESVDALVDQYPEMYLHSKPMSVGAVMAAMQWKYSAGLPFLPVVQSRRTLATSPWFARIRRAAEKLLSNPALPGNAFHCFPKTDVVPLEKALKHGGLRTVTASSIVMSIVVNVLGLETAKRLPPPRALVANMLPRTEAGHKSLWEAVASRGETYLADAVKFDSSVPVEVVQEATPALRAYGYRGRWGAKAAESLFRVYYEGIARGWLVNLMDGSVLRKRHGGGTGSTYTSVDNRDWLRMLLPAAWAQLTGEPVANFYQKVTLANASDDLTIGIAPNSYDMNKLSKILFENYGVIIDFTKVDRPDNLPDGFLHLLVVPKDEVDAEMYSRLNLAVPEFSLRTDPDRLAMKRTAYRSDRASLSNDQTSDYLVSRGIGHLQLCSHHPGIYDDLVQEVMEDTTDRLSMWFKNVTWTVSRDSSQRIIDARVDNYGEMQPNLVNRFRRRGLNPVEGERRLRLFVDTWLRSHRIPSYAEVFRSWVTRGSPTRMSAANRYKKVNYLADASFPITDLARIKIIQARSMLLKFAGALSRASPEVGVPIATVGFGWSVYYIEMFVWAHLYRSKGGVRPSDSEFFGALRRSPYAAATDPVTFVWKTYDPEFFDKLVQLAGPRMDHLTTAIFWYTVVYGSLDFFLGVMMRSPVIGWFLHLWLLISELSILYSIANNLHWLGTGTSSNQISSLIPKDQYAFQKQVSAVIIGVLPLAWMEIKGMTKALSILPSVVATVTQVVHATQVTRTVLARANVPVDTPWRAAANAFIQTRGLPQAGIDRVQAIVAGTGSGKSTILPAILLESGAFHLIVICCPTRVSRDEYANPFVDADRIRIVDANRPMSYTPGIICVCTYGYFLQALEYSLSGVEGVLVILDEAHLGHTEIAAAFVLLPAHKRLLLSATPDRHIFGSLPEGAILRVAGGAQFAVPVTVSDAADTDLLVEARRAHPIAFLRALVVHPSERVCETLVRGLEASGVKASVLSRSQPIVSIDGVIVATSVVDTAVTILPPPSMIVDFGYTLEVVPAYLQTPDHRNDVRMVASGASVARQRLGRVGRVAQAVAFVAARAGTGIEQAPIVNPYWYVRSASRAEAIGKVTNVHLAFDLPMQADSLRWLGWDTIRAECDRDSDQAGWYIVCFLVMMGGVTIQDSVLELQGWFHNPAAHEDIDHVIIWVRQCGWELTTPPIYAILVAWSHSPPTFVYIRGQMVFTFTVSHRRRRLPSGRYIGLIGPPGIAIDLLPIPADA